MKKKIIGITLITLSLITLYGCGKDETSSTVDSLPNKSASSSINKKKVTDIIDENKKVLNIDVEVSNTTTVTTKAEETEIVETAESQNSPQKEIIKAEISPSKPTSQQPTATTQAPRQPTAPPTTQAPKQQPTPTQPPTTQAPTPPPPSTPSYIPTSSGYYGDRQVMVNMVNNYRASQGLSTLTYDSGWQIYADRLAKMKAETHSGGHGYAMENVAYGSYTDTYDFIFKGWQNSAGHNRTMLDQSGSQGKYIAFSAYYDANQRFSYFVLVIEDDSYQEHHGYVTAIICEEWWTGELMPDESIDWTMEQFKSYFHEKGYGKYYPHL